MEKLLESEGYETLEELLEATFSDTVSPGICTNDGCDYTVEVEPDQDRGWCESRGTNTVKSLYVGLSFRAYPRHRPDHQRCKMPQPTNSAHPAVQNP
jgi:hypothetical protein